jgi:hypothetical protein
MKCAILMRSAWIRIFGVERERDRGRERKRVLSS